MRISNVTAKIKKETASFLAQVDRSNEIVFLVLLSFYVAVYAILKIAWTRNLQNPTDYCRSIMLGIIMWGSAIYLFYNIIEWKNLWKNTFALIFIAVILLGLTFVFSKIMSTNSYGVVFDVFFCIMACGKNYKKILRCIAGVVTACLILAEIGVICGFALDVTKPENIHPGHSFGIVYPNTWGFMCFLVLMIIWYLWLRRKKILTFVMCWGAALVMIFIVYCRTIGLLTIVFPFAALFVDCLEGRADRRAAAVEADETDAAVIVREDNKDVDVNGHKEKKPKKTDKTLLSTILSKIIIAIPYIAFAIMLILSLNVEWVHSHFYYTWFHNFAMRFVVGGLFLRQYGFNLIGNVMQSNALQFVRVNDEFIEVRILDSSFGAYLIMRGFLWVCGCMSWLCVAIWKALKKRDYAIPFLCTIILVFAMMERPGLEMWYNFILIYPLAKVVGKVGTESVLEFDVSTQTAAVSEGIIKEEAGVDDHYHATD